MKQESSSANGHHSVVIGATGNLGRHICAAFTAAGHDVVGVARSAVDDIAASRIVPLDVVASDPAEIRRALAAHDPDVVVNVSGGWGATEQEMRDAHITLVDNLVTAVAGLEGRPRLVHVGTVHEYGPVPSGVSIDEKRLPEPTTLYARTKLAGSRIVLDATAAVQIDGTVLRVVNVCGPGAQSASFLGSLTSRLCGTVPGTPIELTIADAQRDYVDVRDVADAVVRAASADAIGEAVSMRTLLTTLVEAAGLDPRGHRRDPGRGHQQGRGLDPGRHHPRPCSAGLGALHLIAHVPGGHVRADPYHDRHVTAPVACTAPGHPVGTLPVRTYDDSGPVRDRHGGRPCPSGRAHDALAAGPARLHHPAAAVPAVAGGIRAAGRNRGPPDAPGRARPVEHRPRHRQRRA
ncbi:hypothetical protein GCM10009799_41550 [Nocardiopsis rhodophaea]|uniref:NAD-dependent epimerase/dehydratase domain-containing protein n=1 Tax=Nocardiopsis rhodophaea TaxID=280238 RepID=A0ABN2THU8_9ACTN